MERNRRTLSDLLETLEEAGAAHALFGGLAAVYYGENRNTADVDLLISHRFLEPIQVGLERRGYKVRRFPHVTKIYLRDEAQSAGDLMALETNGVLCAAFAEADPAVILDLPVRVVRRGVLVALKFEAAVSPRRHPGNRSRDVLDIRAALAREFGPQDERVAFEIAGRMYPGAVADLEALIDDLRHGRQPRVALRAARRSTFLRRHGLAAFRRGSPGAPRG